MRKILLFLLLAMTLPCIAQEVIMNQPSADVVAKGHTFVRFDEFYTQKPAFYQENLNVAFGLFKNFEVSLNNVNAFNRQPTPDQLVFGFKYAPVKTDHWTVYFGSQLIQPLTSKYYSQGNFTYQGVAYSVGNWRFTGGSFYSHNAVAYGNRAGGMTGVEWTAKKFKNGWSLVPMVDWASGAGTNGYASPGISFNKGNFFFCPGYMIGNPHNPNGAHQSFIMTGYTF